MEFSPDGRKLAVARQSSFEMWTQATRMYDTIAGDTRPDHLAFAPDGKTLLSGGRDNKSHLWDAASLARKETVHGHGDVVWAVAFSPDGKAVASASKDLVFLSELG